MHQLFSPIIVLNGLGPKIQQKLNAIGIFNLEHLLFHLPTRYQDKTKLTKLNQAQVGDEVLIQLTIEHIEQVSTHQRQLLCYLSDSGHQDLLLRFFHFNQKQNFIRGDIIQCFGEIKIGKNSLEMHHPEYRLISKGQAHLLEKTLSPIYALTANIHQAQMKKWIDIALETLQQSNLYDNFKNLANNSMPTLKQALKTLHHPKVNDNIEQITNFNHPSQQRLIIEELCAQRLNLLQLKDKRKSKKSNIFKIKDVLTKKVLNVLGFQLTKAQQRSIDEINSDLASNFPMLRLLQGDVGSGKTIVAVFACLQAIENGFQVTIMAPNEALASQHLQEFSNYLDPLGIDIAFLTGSQSATQRVERLKKIIIDEVKIIIGTHVFLQTQVVFNKLGLVIIDEQHKFGVHQRLSLVQKAHNTPHQLVMTATPIPTSLIMSAYADLDCSVIDELPPGRKPTKTIALSNDKKDKVIEKIKQVCTTGNQVYWVCTLIEESETLRAKSATSTHHYLQENLKELTVVLIHGKMHKDEKSTIMDQFLKNKIDVLVATTVIEIGVNVTNSPLIVIENSERLGLSQLHQLRSRAGRDTNTSVCILMYQAPLSHSSFVRLDTLRQTNDGFKIAQKDLELRGPGEILGTQQAGIANMKIANIVRDRYLLKQVYFYSEKFLKLRKDKQQALITRWITDDKSQYGNT
ncbi:ATP-dependent DNA helicase RecG [Candidatus Ruthia magnifica str. Cm (Calyptogena magnifica)]|uniref:Probable DNA 3'-5' helicase RecG n=1 Tax=Ruthia magnifica subsp. Calyptogena magnifica TaxID=413404 RepID=A1AXI4_RUTMC|nr:ATP-dependent DNA helicase RecG [Candidatus Ruthturnera calyptogenae]ABL02641.1 ATP-dependent DNA helicase RecG [Candidatus Ruthia magnifica str. Cm (Calyptogena magnifica)]